MKSITTVFPRSAYLSGAAGVAAVYTHDSSLCDVLGSAKSLRVQMFGYNNNNAKVTITVYETSMPQGRPSEVGKVISGAGITNETVLRPALFDISGPFAGRVELLLQVEEDTAGPDQVGFDLEVVATLIMEE